MNILITGGAGYIGSTTLNLLKEQGHQIFVIDDLSYGDQSKIAGSKLFEFNLSDPDAVEKIKDILQDQKIDAVIHFAARKQVGESVELPEYYYLQNLGGLSNLLLAMKETNTKKLIFSSSAAVYGIPEAVDLDEQGLILESSRKNPINPYGETKYYGEKLISDSQKSWGLNYIALRYFNVAGALNSKLKDNQALNLIPIINKKVNEHQPVEIFGDDYNTPDGTCVRDYIHVVDLANAHILALNFLIENNNQMIGEVFNVGTGQGSSVKEVVEVYREVSGSDLEVKISPRRLGDPDQLVANSQKIKDMLGFSPQYNLFDIIKSAIE